MIRGLICFALCATGLTAQTKSPPVLTFSAASLRMLPEWKVGQPTLRIGEDPSDDATVLNLASLPIRLSDGRIVVPNGQKELRYFDATGKPLMIAGQRGQGPGDFRQLWGIYPLPGDSVLVFDSYGPPSRFSVFSPSGRFVRLFELTIRSTDVVLLPDRSFATMRPDLAPFQAFLNSGKTGVVEKTSALLRLRLDGTSDSLFSVRGNPDAVIGPGRWTGVQLAPSPFLTAGANGIVVGNGRSFELHWFDVAGKPLRIIRVAEVPQTVTDAHKARFQAAAEAVAARGRPLAREGPALTPVWASHLPIIARVRMDRAGRIWVRRWTFDDEPEAEWVVFSAVGRPVARVRFPGTFTFHDADVDYALGRYTDDDGVQSVRMYKLPR